MQNRYVGDVGDFGKYALLRALGDIGIERPIRVSVVWCLVPDETHNHDGRHISYLDSVEITSLDIELAFLLRKVIKSGRRRVSEINASKVLPAGTVFYEPILCPPNVRQLTREDRVRHRYRWWKACLNATRTSHLVFFDPDNGLEVESVPKHHSKAGKYIYWDELVPFWKRRQSLLVYHHLNRTKPGAAQIDEMAMTIQMKFVDAIVRPLVFRRGSCRVFWLICHRSAIGREIERRVDIFLKKGWAVHFRSF